MKVFPIVLPPLKKRKEDIPLLTRHFIDRQNHTTGKNITGISQYAMRVFLDHSWPGNVRELENAIEHAFVLCNRGQIELSDLPLEIRQPEGQFGPEGILSTDTKKVRIGKSLSKERLMELLKTCDWNKAEVGRRLGVSRTAVWKYMKKWDIPLKNPAGKL